MNCPLCGHAPVVDFLTPEQDTFDRKAYLECRRCRLVFVHPRFHLTRAEEKARYDLHTNHPGDEGYVRFLERLTVPLSARLSPGAEGLDFGCGPGPTLSVIMGKAGFKVSNYDPIYFPEIELLQRQYDFIACTEAAEHFFNPGEEFVRLEKILRPGGCLGVMTDFLIQPEKFLAWHYRRDPAHVCFYRRETFEFLASAHGWQADFPAASVVLLEKHL